MIVVAIWLLVMRVVDLFWLSASDSSHLHWLDLAAPAGVGGIWIAAFFRQLKQRPPLPLHDPELEEALENGRN
jgi:hypothetical protein